MTAYAADSPLLKRFENVADTFRSGASSPRGYLDTCLESIAARPDIEAFTLLDIPAARDAADKATQRYAASAPLSEIDGLPFGIKDIIDWAGYPCRMNSPIMADYVPYTDAACIAALKAAGAIPVGKTVTTEFACGESGPTRNPFDPDRTPGGSSSGSAAAVGIGMLPAALGTQTRGSIIRPASFCGAFGYMPSHGALNAGGVHPVAESQDCVGVIASGLWECWAVARAIAEGVGGRPGHSGLESGAFPDPAPPARVALVQTRGWAETGADARAAFKTLTDRLAAAGIACADRTRDAALDRFERLLENIDPVSLGIIAFEMRHPYAEYARIRPGLLGPKIEQSLARSAAMTLADYRRNLAERDTLRAAYMDLGGEYDLILTLSAPGAAPKGLAFTGSRSFVAPWTLLNVPALSLPLLSVESLPLGVQAIGFPGADRRLIALARAICDLADIPA